MKRGRAATRGARPGWDRIRGKEMQNSAWVALLRHIPAEQQDQYMLVTVSGTEVAIQSLLRIEEGFVALKGRLAGSQEAGRVFFIPYEQIDYFGTQKPIKDTEFAEVFDSLVVPAADPDPNNGVAQPDPALPGNGVTREPSPRPVIRSE